MNARAARVLTLPVVSEPVAAHPAVERRDYGDGVLVLFPFGAPVSLRRAEPADAAPVHALLEQHVAEGRVLPRSLGQIYRTIRDFVIAVQDDAVVGSASLRIHSAGLAEVAALAVAPACQGRGVGRRMVETLVDEARALGIARVFALTLEDGFFHRLGFRTGSVAEFPEKLAADCSGCAKRTHCVEICVVRDLAT